MHIFHRNGHEAARSHAADDGVRTRIDPRASEQSVHNDGLDASPNIIKHASRRLLSSDAGSARCSFMLAELEGIKAELRTIYLERSQPIERGNGLQDDSLVS